MPSQAFEIPFLFIYSFPGPLLNNCSFLFFSCLFFSPAPHLYHFRFCTPPREPSCRDKEERRSRIIAEARVLLLQRRRLSIRLPGTPSVCRQRHGSVLAELEHLLRSPSKSSYSSIAASESFHLGELTRYQVPRLLWEGSSLQTSLRSR